MKKKDILSFLVFGVVSLSCTSDSGMDPNAKPVVALPLATGNVWEFRHTTRDSNDTILDSSSVTMSVGVRDTFGVEIGYPLLNFIFTIIASGPDIWINKADGVYHIVGRPQPFPPHVSRALAYTTWPGDTLRFAGYLIYTSSLFEAIVVPAGSYSCVRYDLLMSGDTLAQIFVAPNIGIVKAWQQYGVSRRLVDELTSYQIN